MRGYAGEEVKTLTFDEKYGDIREDGLTVIQEHGGAGWPALAREIAYAVNMLRCARAAESLPFRRTLEENED